MPIFILAALTAFSATGFAKQVPQPVSADLKYLVEPRGDRVVDFSHAGYRGGGVPLPDVPARVLVMPAPGDAGTRIQAAIDHVSALAPDAKGLRGAVQLAAGRYEIAGQLKLNASGVVLRGAGDSASGTILVATGTDRRALIEVAGRVDRQNVGQPIAVAAEYVPSGATQLRLASTAGVVVGSYVTIERPSPATWIKLLGMDEAPGRQPYIWKAGAFNVRWDRVVTAVNGDTITLDVPLTVALDAQFDGATVTPFASDSFIQNVGIENLRCESVFDAANPLDEQHAWNAIDLHAVRDGWVAGVTGVHFAGTVVQAGVRTARITVQDCASLAPVSEIAGYRRMAFHTRGQQTLFLRCRSESGKNDFTVGYFSAGPNVFLECTAKETAGFSGSIGSWASGLLFDSVSIDGGALRLDNLETWNQGVGWAAVNSVIWQSSASVIVCRSPPGGVNWAVGVWAQFVGDGRWSVVNEFANPVSLYRAQLTARLGADALVALEPRKFSAVPSGLATIAPKPVVPANADDAKPLALSNGWLTAGGRVLIGKQQAGAWWLGRLEPGLASAVGVAITRFAPGRAGTGLTDEIPSLAAGMVSRGEVAFRHHYGLWYDRRRIDHEMIRRPDADVWPPFFEQPFARSGQGRAWDGLSRYDLTKYNPWYFGRLRAFAAEGKRHGLVLVNEMYFQHNIIESGAHWVDSPWRPVNNINNTGFKEPPPFTGDTIKMDVEFYDVMHPVRRELHRAYIRQCLANLADEPNVLHTLSAENSGPLHFMQFWLDVVAEWQRETGRDPLIALSACKDVQDAILADPARAALIDVVDLTYWFRTEDGKEYAPAGGKSLAPRQHARLWKGGGPSAASIAGMVREYRDKFPGKPVISALDQAEGWAFVAAGGSFAKLPPTTDVEILAAISRMKPHGKAGPKAWALGEGGVGYFAVALGEDASVDLRGETGVFRVRRIDATTGRPEERTESVEAGRIVSLPALSGRTTIVWLTR
jgi:hypothetical protein